MTKKAAPCRNTNYLYTGQFYDRVIGFPFYDTNIVKHLFLYILMAQPGNGRNGNRNNCNAFLKI